MGKKKDEQTRLLESENERLRDAISKMWLEVHRVHHKGPVEKCKEKSCRQATDSLVQGGERDREEDMRCLAGAFFEKLRRDKYEYGGWGIDPKRPFGDEDVDGSILEIIGMRESSKDDRAEMQRSYAAALYDDLGPWLQNFWEKHWADEGDEEEDGE